MDCNIVRLFRYRFRALQLFRKQRLSSGDHNLLTAVKLVDHKGYTCAKSLIGKSPALEFIGRDLEIYPKRSVVMDDRGCRDNDTFPGFAGLFKKPQHRGTRAEMQMVLL